MVGIRREVFGSRANVFRVRILDGLDREDYVLLPSLR